MSVDWRLPPSSPCKCRGPHLEWEGQSGDGLVFLAGKLLVMYGQAKLWERPATQGRLTNYMGSLRAVLQKRPDGVPVTNGKQPIACLFHAYLCICNGGHACLHNQFYGCKSIYFLFQRAMLFSCQETHQLLNGLSNSSCWSFAIWSISLLLVKLIMWLDY